MTLAYLEVAAAFVLTALSFSCPRSPSVFSAAVFVAVSFSPMLHTRGARLEHAQFA